MEPAKGFEDLWIWQQASILVKEVRQSKEVGMNTSTLGPWHPSTSSGA